MENRQEPRNTGEKTLCPEIHSENTQPPGPPLAVLLSRAGVLGGEKIHEGRNRGNRSDQKTGGISPHFTD